MSNEQKESMAMASDGECAARRSQLIKSGIIKENTKRFTKKGDGSYAVPTTTYSKSLRKNLEKKGVISSNRFNIPPLSGRISSLDEGEYKVTSIQGDAQYERRKLLYFHMLQDILITRRELNLNLAPKQVGDPDWIF